MGRTGPASCSRCPASPHRTRAVPKRRSQAAEDVSGPGAMAQICWQTDARNCTGPCHSNRAPRENSNLRAAQIRWHRTAGAVSGRFWSPRRG